VLFDVFGTVPASHPASRAGGRSWPARNCR
jgi:hypothetical protein